jgi:ribose-phosphate pyrophosphokinase
LIGSFVTDSVAPFRLGREAAWSKLDIFSAAPLLAEAIARLHDGRALTDRVVF